MCSVFGRRLSGRFKLHEAIQQGDIQCLAELARTSSAGVNEYDDAGQAALHLAADQDLPEAVCLLRSHGADVNVPREEDARTPLHIAVNEGHEDVVRALLTNGASVSATDFDGWGPLHVASYYGAAALADTLLRNGAKVNARTHKGQTPLHIAAEMAESQWLNRAYDYPLTMKLLIAAMGSETVDARDAYGQTPLQLATKNLDLPTMRLLLDHGASPAPSKAASGGGDSARSGDGGGGGGVGPLAQSPLGLAVSRSSSEAAALLLRRGADINCSDAGGMTPLLLAVEANSPSMVRWLLDGGANPRATSAHGWAAMHYAVRLGHEACALALVQAVPELISEEDENGLSPLATAAEVGAGDVATTLLDKGADVNQTEPTRLITALHVAAYHDQGAMMKLLLEHGAQINACDANGHTPLHIASLLNKGHLVPLLLGAGADVALRDKQDKTPEDLAVKSNSEEVVKQFAVLRM